jgi:hypothetical protein
MAEPNARAKPFALDAVHPDRGAAGLTPLIRLATAFALERVHDALRAVKNDAVDGAAVVVVYGGLPAA